MAPSLDRVTVEHEVDWDPANPGTNLSEVKWDSTILGELDASLFHVSDTYTEMSPAKLVLCTGGPQISRDCDPENGLAIRGDGGPILHVASVDLIGQVERVRQIPVASPAGRI
jgi:hypothetical protein